MPPIEITDYHAEHLYEYSFDELIDTFKPLKDEEDKRYIKIHKYPTIFSILPSAMKKDYPQMSKTSIQIYATRLGMSIFSHDDRVSNIIDRYNESMYNTSPENITEAALFRHKILYDYCTPTSNNGCIYLATTKEVKSYLSENGESLGLSEYQLSVMFFLLGVERATLKPYHKELIDKEIKLCWDILGLRQKSLFTKG